MTSRSRPVRPISLSPSIPLAAVTVSLLFVGCARVRPFQPRIEEGGRAVSIAVSPGSDRTLFVASETGGLFKSTNRGDTWRHVDSLPPWRVTDVEFHRDDDDLVIATARGDFKTAHQGAIWRSTDRGRIWSQPATGIPAAGARCGDRPDAYAVSFEPGTDNVYVGTDCGLASSGDGGATWTHLQLDPTRPVNDAKTQNRVWDVVAFGNGRINVAAEDGLWSTRNGGAHWTRSSSPGAGRRWVTHAFAASPYDSDHVFHAGADAKLYFSDDAGVSWNEVRAGVTGRPVFVRAARSVSGESDEFDVYFGHGVRIFRRTYRDGDPPTALGAGWTQLVEDHADPADVAFRRDGRTPLLLATDGGLHGTDDDGASWTLKGAGRDGYHALQITEVTGQAVTGDDPHLDLYLGTQDNNVWASSDGGRSWPKSRCCEGFYLGTPRSSVDHGDAKVSGVSCGPCVSFLGEPHLASHAEFPDAPDGDSVDEKREGRVFLVQPRHYIQRVVNNDVDPGLNLLALTRDTGGRWTIRSGFAPRPANRPLLGGPAAEPTIYWAVERPGTTLQGHPNRGLIRIDNLYGPGDLVVTDADGNNFESLGTFPTMFAWYMVFGVDPEEPNHLIAPDLGTGEMKVSRDGGRNWAVDADLTDLVTDGGNFRFNRGRFVHVQHIAFDPENSCHILVGTAQNGIIRSTDGGFSWEKVARTERITNLSSIFFGTGRAQYVSSYGRGLWTVRIDRPPHPPAGRAWRCSPAELRLEWPPPERDHDPIFVEIDTGERRELSTASLEACPECEWLTVGWGRFTDVVIDTKRGRAVSVAVSGGVVRAVTADGVERDASVDIDLRRSPGHFGGLESLAKLAGEGLSIRALGFVDGALRVALAGEGELFVEGQTPPALTLSAGGRVEADLAVEPAERVSVRGSGFRPQADGGAPVEIYLDGAALDAAGEVGSQGDFLIELDSARVPALVPGDYEILAVQRGAGGLRAERATLRVVVGDRWAEPETGR